MLFVKYIEIINVYFIFQDDAVRRNLRVILDYLDLPLDGMCQYILKFSTDGARLTNNDTGVQGTIRILDVDNDVRPITPSRLPPRFHREICVFYFIGKFYETHYSFTGVVNCINALFHVFVRF